jgi:hypothetical protein
MRKNFIRTLTSFQADTNSNEHAITENMRGAMSLRAKGKDREAGFLARGYAQSRKS